ncbi:MAG: hypothetical protein U5L09_07150 [Bacteroidales bacterium]|nr:hypothetical protein [Bacteroidales bacterium]
MASISSGNQRRWQLFRYSPSKSPRYTRAIMVIWAAGQATLTMNVTGNGACTGDCTAMKSPSFAKEPTADAGDDLDICQPGEVPRTMPPLQMLRPCSESLRSGTFDDAALQNPVLYSLGRGF